MLLHLKNLGENGVVPQYLFTHFKKFKYFTYVLTVLVAKVPQNWPGFRKK